MLSGREAVNVLFNSKITLHMFIMTGFVVLRVAMLRGWVSFNPYFHTTETR